MLICRPATNWRNFNRGLNYYKASTRRPSSHVGKTPDPNLPPNKSGLPLSWQCRTQRDQGLPQGLLPNPFLSAVPSRQAYLHYYYSCTTFYYSFQQTKPSQYVPYRILLTYYSQQQGNLNKKNNLIQNLRICCFSALPSVFQ